MFNVYLIKLYGITGITEIGIFDESICYVNPGFSEFLFI